MPLYEYACLGCGHRLEMLRSMSQADAPLVCPDCGETNVRRLISKIMAVSKSNAESAPVMAPSMPMGGGGCCGGGCGCH